ncbi:MAG TPA: methylenetetrahydrofolate reductase [Acidimicrobiia bacterium]
MSESLVKALLTGADFEVIPLKSVMDQVATIPPGSTVSVTASPAKGMKTTVDLAIELQNQGYRAVPHLSARMIEGRQDLGSIIKRLDDGGVSRAFITGGDAEQRGIYFDALSLLLDLAELGHPFFEVGITGYPEGHPAIPEDRLRKALVEKQAHATYIVTQMCFNPKAIVDWVNTIRADGVTLPIKVGVPGAVEPARLLTIGARIGVGDSLRFVAKNRRALFRILRPGRYRPDRIIEPLGRLGEGLGLTGIHVFTFNQVGPTVAWHNKALARLG